MNHEPVQTTSAGGSCALQGCLFGAVALFVVMLIGMLYLAFVRFQENTQPAPTEVSFVIIAHDGKL